MHVLRQSSAPAPACEPVPRPWRKLSVLVVEDSRCAADILGLFFESKGHDVTVVYDGIEAVKQTTLRPPDLILMDLGLPEMNGLNATREIRRMEKADGIHIVALSGFDG